MVHELLGMNNNRVILKGAPGIKQELEEVVLSPSADEFFAKHRFSNFGELAEAIAELLDNYQRQSKKNENIKSIEDMQNFMERYPEFRAQSHNVSKHVAIMGELGRLVEVCNLMDVSAFEQELACTDDHAAHIKELMEKLSSPQVKVPDKLRLGLLYALRYETTGQIGMVKSQMAQGGVSPDKVALVDVLLRYAGSAARSPGLYGKRDAFSKFSKSLMTNIQGVSNVYSQHVPLLMETIKQAFKGTLKNDSYSTVEGGGELPKEIFIYMVGGVTYEEARAVAEFNEQNTAGQRVILGGSTVHNSTSFLEELRAL
jgi:vacuolar protein sorting-associated protein 45